MIRTSVSVFLLLVSLQVESDIFLVSEAERQYQSDVETAAFEGMMERGLLEKAIAEKGLTLDESTTFIRETARIASICNILGMRFYQSDFKVKAGELISAGAGHAEVKKEVEKFLSDKIRSGEIDQDAPFEPILMGLQFTEECMKAIKEDPIPTPSSVSSTRDIPEGYALDAESNEIFYNGKLVYRVRQDDIWSFACLEMEGDLKRPQGTAKISGVVRIFPTKCRYQRPMYYGDAMKFAAWAPPQNSSVSFVMSNGSGGSSSAIKYKAVTLNSGRIISESATFMAGEYFSAIVSDECTALINEYDKSQNLMLAGNCRTHSQTSQQYKGM